MVLKGPWKKYTEYLLEKCFQMTRMEINMLAAFEN